MSSLSQWCYTRCRSLWVLIWEDVFGSSSSSICTPSSGCLTSEENPISSMFNFEGSRYNHLNIIMIYSEVCSISLGDDHPTQENQMCNNSTSTQSACLSIPLQSTIYGSRHLINETHHH